MVCPKSNPVWKVSDVAENLAQHENGRNFGIDGGICGDQKHHLSRKRRGEGDNRSDERRCEHHFRPCKRVQSLGQTVDQKAFKTATYPGFRK